MTAQTALLLLLYNDDGPDEIKTLPDLIRIDDKLSQKTLPKL